MEKRRDPRIPLAPRGWRAHLVDEMTGKVLGEVVNLSPGGMMLLASYTITTGSLYQVSCIASDESGRERRFSAGVTVLWRSEANQEPGCWVGLKIIDLDVESKKCLMEIGRALAAES